MKGDFTRDTFEAAKHYQQVLTQQGRAQVDSDSNEQAALGARRDETTAVDTIGHCGGPAEAAAFGVFTDATKLTAAEKKHLQELNVNTPLGTGNFFLSAGRYYVDGLQCENERAIPYTVQPDRFDVPPLTNGKDYLLYLDVWRRHITALEDGQVRESALGGPDTATRVKTVWQVRTLELGAIDPNNPCGSGANDFNKLSDPGTAMLTADTAKEQAQKDPCIVPPSAGFTGLENQLYRVEIHEPGTAVDAGVVGGSTEVTLPGVNDPGNQITVKGGTWNVGTPVELYPSKAGSVKGQVAWITAVNAKVLTLSGPVTGLVDDDKPRLRHVNATWKWSRENGSVVTRIEKIDGKKITVNSLGPDKNLGFLKDAWVEILDDQLELDGKPGQLVQIDDVDEATPIITLKSDATKLAANANGIIPAHHPKLRRWEGVAGVKFVADPNANWLPLENGIQVRFAPNGDYRTGHFWQIPARTATAQSPNGDIEWPVDKNNRIALAPRGITHHFCRLGIVTVKADGSIEATDCRCLYPVLTAVPRLFYVSGDGQEVMPDLTKPAELFKLPEPLIAGVANLHTNSKVRFTITEGNGRIESGGQSATGLNKFIDITPAANGQASCEFSLDCVNHHQQITARTLDADCGGVLLPLIFNANLSIASEVAYDPGACGGLQGQRTVQDALSRLAGMASLHKISGDGQAGETGKKLPRPLVVLAANRCGAADQLEVQFKVVSGGGSVTPAAVPTGTVNPGLASCEWALGPGAGTQELDATLVSNDPFRPVTEPSTVRFTAFSVEASNDSSPVRVIDVRLLGEDKRLPNESRLQPPRLGKGIGFICDGLIAADTVLDSVKIAGGMILRDQPTCFGTVEIPYPLMQSEKTDVSQDLDINPELLLGYRPLVLHAAVTVEKLNDNVEPGAGKPISQIKWQPDEVAVRFLERILSRLSGFKPRPSAVLLRLTLKGNFIWSQETRELFKNETPGGFLDGDTFRAPERFGIILPSGDKRRGGDFEMWFWLVPENTKQPPVITVQPKDLNILAGSTAMFDVTVIGTEPFRYQWQKNGVDIAGATDPSFTIKKVTSAHEGEYSVMVQNEFGKAQSTPALLSIRID